MPKARSKVSRKRKFYGNRFTKLALNSNNSTSASEAKLSTFDSFHVPEPEFHGSTGNRIINFQALMGIISILCCPECYATGLKLAEDSKEGLCSNLCVACSCGFMTGFTSTPKENKKLSLNTLLVFGLRLIGKGFTAGKKLLCTLNLPCISKNTFRAHELKLLEAVQLCSEENMKAASKEVQNLKKSTTCVVSVDGSWQRRGHMSLNGCVSVISIDTGKILDLEVMTQYCKMCELNVKREHVCSNYKGSSGNMEAVGAFRIFERSLIKRDLQYTEYYGDCDSKGFLQVKDIYGENSVTKLECIGHIQKRVGSRLRKLKKNTKVLGGKGKLTDKFIDKLQNYYGIAIRRNIGCLKKMQSAVIAAFFHCCSSNQNPMHGQCPSEKDSWCKYKQALSDGKVYVEKTAGLSNYVIKVIKPTYLALCDKELLKKCLHGKTQNNNESFNNVLWSVLPKEIFVHKKTFFLGSYMAVLLYNSGYLGLLPVFNYLGIGIDPTTLKNYMGIDKEIIQKSKRQSLPSTKLSRKKQKAKKKSKLAKNEAKEGLSYKYGEF
ncbi:uncharacterized protein TNCV_4486381 [Trichonephila clavipes]|nr:uncharacterized protein TNCV_4486381 [Trichonephila clavipes]